MRVVTLIRRVDWNRLRVGVVAGHHLWLAAALVFAPRATVFTEGTRPAFALWTPLGWALWFAIGGLAAAFLAARVTAWVQVLTWFAVFPAQVVWLAASVIAVKAKEGSSIGVVMWFVAFLYTLLTACQLAYSSTGKR